MRFPMLVSACTCLTLCVCAVIFLRLPSEVPLPEPRALVNNWTRAAAVDENINECTNLAELEAAVDGLASLGGAIGANNVTEKNAEVAAYTLALTAWRARHPGPQPGCRKEALAKSLCAEGARLGSFKRWINTKEPSFWERNMMELQGHVSTEADCNAFETYMAAGWKPDVFNWIQSSFSIRHVDPLFQDPEYNAVYAKAGHLAPHYGPPESPVFSRQGLLWQKKRVQNLNYIRLLRRVVPGWNLGKVQQWVEFGGGSGDLAACLFDLGFRGTHFVVDLPSMNLMHRYWLRSSGVPVYLGKNLAPNPAAVRGKIILESSMEDTLFGAHLDSAIQRDSVFMGTYSFTEADEETRERFRPLIQNFGVIFLVFWSTFMGYDNDAYMLRWLDDSLWATHNVLAWKHEGNGFYFLAVRKDIGEVACVPEFNCHWSKYHHFFFYGGRAIEFFRKKYMFVSFASVGALFGLGYYCCAGNGRKERKLG